MSTGKVYGLTLEKMLAGSIDFVNDDIRCCLLTTTYIPDQDNDEFYSDLTGEATGTGYTTGGVLVTGVTVTTVDWVMAIDCDDPSWLTATLTGVRYAVFYKDTGVASTSPLICWVDFTGPQSVVADDFFVFIPSNGLIRFSAA